MRIHRYAPWTAHIWSNSIITTAPCRVIHAPADSFLSSYLQFTYTLQNIHPFSKLRTSHAWQCGIINYVRIKLCNCETSEHIHYPFVLLWFIRFQMVHRRKWCLIGFACDLYCYFELFKLIFPTWKFQIIEFYSEKLTIVNSFIKGLVIHMYICVYVMTALDKGKIKSKYKIIVFYRSFCKYIV